MALDLMQVATLAKDATLQQRVAVACYYVAREVINEDPTTPGNPLRIQFAHSIVNQDLTVFLRYTIVVVTDPVIVAATPVSQTNISDAQIITAVRSAWNALSGYHVNE